MLAAAFAALYLRKLLLCWVDGTSSPRLSEERELNSRYPRIIGNFGPCIGRFIAKGVLFVQAFSMGGLNISPKLDAYIPHLSTLSFTGACSISFRGSVQA